MKSLTFDIPKCTAQKKCGRIGVFARNNTINTIGTICTFNTINTTNTINATNTINTINTMNTIYTTNTINTIITFNTINTFNTTNTINTISTLNTIDTIKTTNTTKNTSTINTINTIDTINTINTINTYMYKYIKYTLICPSYPHDSATLVRCFDAIAACAARHQVSSQVRWRARTNGIKTKLGVLGENHRKTIGKPQENPKNGGFVRENPNLKWMI